MREPSSAGSLTIWPQWPGVDENEVRSFNWVSYIVALAQTLEPTSLIFPDTLTGS